MPFAGRPTTWSASRRGVAIGLGALIDEAALDQRIGDELPQILRGAALHARGDFLGEQFEQEIGHGGALSRPRRQRGEARLLPEELGAGSFLLYMYSRRFQMLALRLAPEIEKRLEALARKTGRTKSFYAREAILRHLDDIEDAHLARERLGRRRGRVSLEALEKELGAGPAK